MFLLRFDMRAATAEHYAAALDMARWADEHGALAVVASEHHASPDGYLPSPLPFVAALAAVTTTTPLQVAALIAPLHDPIELAESMAVIDLLSGGRVSYVLGAGYREPEFAMFGRSYEDRGADLEAIVGVLRQAWTGEPFEYDGRPCHVTPTPMTPGGPLLLLGGGTPGAVRRAVRCGLGMITERNAGLAELYERECEAAGVEPQLFFEAPAHAVTAFVADDPDELWATIGDHLLHDARLYRAWNEAVHRPMPTSVTTADTIDELRGPDSPYRVFTPDEAVEHIRSEGSLIMHPLCGGIPPDVAWTSLELLGSKVLPQLG
jgi:alkanesulfonate monooxygenase SsuD/methylene tetrahydromethanopterin reductase-like flavin-dependent oxidoreductase (luciferase family)